MNTLQIFVIIYLAMIANAFWEAYVEGRNTMEVGKVGWKIKIGEYYLTGYHFYLFFIMWPLLLSLPFVVYGWNQKLFGILISAYLSGLILEDFMWYVVNPVVKLSEWGTGFSNHYPWIKIGKLKFPAFYMVGIILSFLSWYFIWN